MKSGQDIAARFPGLFLVHHNKPSSRVPSHAHEEHHLIMPLKGEVKVDIGTEDIRLGPGKMIFIPSNQEHEFASTNAKEGERLIGLIDPTLWKSTAGVPDKVSILPTHQLCKEILFYLLLNPQSKSVKSLIRVLIETLHEALETARTLGSAHSLAHLLGRSRDPRVAKAVAFIETNYREDIRMQDIAKASALSLRNLNRLFNDELGVGPKEVIIRLRLEEARRLLREERVSVTEASLAVGYQSLSRFIQSFRETFGQLPSEVRRN